MPYSFFASMPPYLGPTGGVVSDGPLWWRPKYYGAIPPPLPPQTPVVTPFEPPSEDAADRAKPE
jgi:hypothetical protein